ncbi:hypothetical protein [Phytomonospora endophytica]|uniref:Uncharacterized protein n=1 Tax=Phytomonospora endophytica TaxID=714109 RepID=A0A841FV33_9ACTN|nr:hypothetical protein [Phytomonospora endophytica]MBB6039866.1 hypothetical protein [Phytomonospora endophytica]GIG70278.1 hypothetical protein Pen01_65730 [Phytomonospora endophytica]
MSLHNLAELPPHITALGGASSTLFLTTGLALLGRWARHHHCTTPQLLASLARRTAATPRSVLSLVFPHAFRRLRGRHRMWDLHEVQALIRADHRTLTRRS